MRALLAFLFLLLAPPSFAQQTADETAIRDLIDRWYVELKKENDGHHYSLLAPGSIDASPPYYHADNGSAALGPRIYDSLAARALQFSYDIDVLKIDPNFAKAVVWERGYFYAWAAQATYENAASTTFVFEKRDGSWQILAHQTGSQGIPPNKITSPLPDLRALYYSTDGKSRDPAEDTKNANKF